jgi:amidase
LKIVHSDELIYVFSRTIAPVLTVNPGEDVLFETRDARGGRAMRLSDNYSPPPPQPVEKTNPVTGPVFIAGASPGDALMVEIQSIKLGSYGYVSARPGIGVLKDKVKTPWARAVRVSDGIVHFSEKVSFPTRPMIGTIGVAPGGQDVGTFHPGPHGGNMDCNDIVVGSILYLPIFVEGALFGLGDAHASMGDGETSGGGLDISTDVVVRLDLVKGWGLKRPLVVTPEHFVIVYNAGGLQEAVRGVVDETVDLFSQRLGLSLEETIALVSTRGDVKICQACDGPVDVIVRLQMPRLFNLP